MTENTENSPMTNAACPPLDVETLLEALRLTGLGSARYSLSNADGRTREQLAAEYARLQAESPAQEPCPDCGHPPDAHLDSAGCYCGCTERFARLVPAEDEGRCPYCGQPMEPGEWDAGRECENPECPGLQAGSPAQEPWPLTCCAGAVTHAPDCPTGINANPYATATGTERLRAMTEFEKAAAIERDQQWSQMAPSDTVPLWSRERLADAYFIACHDRRGLLNELGWRARAALEAGDET